MASYLDIILDTTAPASVQLQIDNDNVFTTSQLVTATMSTSDVDTTGYQMKLWGDVDTAYDVNIQTLEGASAWITYEASKQVKVSIGDGSKTLYVKIRDDVWNESAQASDAITLNTAVPTVTISGQNVTKISKITGKNELTFSFTSDVAFTEYKMKYVTSTSAAEDTGSQVPTTNGSTNMSGTGTFASGSPISCVIRGADLELASANDGTKKIKVFVKNEAGIWSV